LFHFVKIVACFLKPFTKLRKLSTTNAYILIFLSPPLPPVALIALRASPT